MGNHNPVHTLQHTDQIRQADWPGTVSIWVQEQLIILSSSGNCEVPVLHGREDNGARVAWVDSRMPGDTVCCLKGVACELTWLCLNFSLTGEIEQDKSVLAHHVLVKKGLVGEGGYDGSTTRDPCSTA
jgi:hypothetical protein